MKRLKNVLMVTSLILVVMILAVACGSKSVDLFLDLQKDESYNLKTTVTFKMDQELLDRQMKMEQTMVAVNRFTVVERIDQDNYLMNVEYVDMDMDMKMSSDGENIMSENLADEFKDIFAGYKVQMQVTNRGEVSNIQGFDTFLKNMVERMNQKAGLNEAQIQANQAMLEGIANEKQLKTSWERMFAYMPKESVKVGDSWEENLNLSEPVPFTIAITYTLKSVKNGECVIEIDGKADLNEPTVLQGFSVDAKIKGVFKGEYVLNQSNGWLKRANITQEISALMSTESEGEKQEIPLEFTATMEMSSY